MGYLLLGFQPLDAVFQTISTITTVGFNSPHPLSNAGKAFTMALILVGVGTALYSLSAVFELLVEGHMRDLVRRRNMERSIDKMTGHVIVCGWGRVGKEVATFLSNAGHDVVIIDRSEERIADTPHAWVCGDVTDDETLERAGIMRAATLVAALDTDADNLYLAVAGRSMKPDLQIIARARNESSEAKLLRAGVDRVVNPQKLGGDRMASFVTQPHVVDFIDVVMHDGSLQFRLGELDVSASSVLSGHTLRSAHIRDRTGALVLAIRRPDGSFETNPPPDSAIRAGDVLISVGTDDQLDALAKFAR
jgi:voltage-gated potassium channel